MAGQGRWFVYYAARHNVDLGLLVGIAGAETTWGDAGTGTPGSGYNPFGFMRNGPGTGLRFGSYREAISRAAALLATSRYRRYTQPGRANPGGFMKTYVGYSSKDWLETTSRYANTLGKGKAGKIPKGGGGGVPTGDPPIVKFAKSFLGIPYVYAGASRKGVDCSGFVMLVYQHFGIHALDSHYTGTQITKGHPVKRSELQPGDLIFSHFENGVTGHVMMYIGHGKLIEAAHTGTDVRIMDMDERIAGQHVEFRRYTNKKSIVGYPTSPSSPTQPGPNPKTPGMPPSPDQEDPMYQPHIGMEIAQSGILGHPGRDPIMDPGGAPAGIQNIWQSLASLQNASPETRLFANRARMWGGG